MDDHLYSIYETLLAHYGELHWWPAKTLYEVMVGAVLTQKTAWGNVEKAIASFGEKLLLKEAVLRGLSAWRNVRKARSVTCSDELASAIRFPPPAGLYMRPGL